MIINKKVTLPPLSYGYESLEPVISKKIMELHHDKHHLAYVNGANAAIDKLGNGQEIDVKAVLRDLSFNLNGHVLHSLFWQNMRTPQENNLPSKKTNDLISDNFGSWDNFKKLFSSAAVTTEGSGWATLTKGDDGQLMVGQVEKHNLLNIYGQKPILVLDVWEHAYYLDYLNDRKTYVDKWWSIVNWDYVEQQL